jgi:TonB family protein
LQNPTAMKHAIYALLFALALDAGAVEQWRAEQWTKQLKKTSVLLKKGSYKEALPILRRVNSEMLEALGPGEAATYGLVVPLIQTALAEVGSGDRTAGLWHWHMAQTLYPKSAESDLSAFGEPGAFLKRNILAIPRPVECPGSNKPNTMPRPISRVEPNFPRGAAIFGTQGAFVVAVRILPDGTVAEPRIVKPLPAPLAYAALEALRKWKFEPATLDGKPVEMAFCLTVNYKVD